MTRAQGRFARARDGVANLRSGLRGFPRQFWLLVVGTFVYTGVAALGFPFEGLYMRQTLHISLLMIGVVFGLVTLTVMPFQVLGGTLTDRFGRKSMMLVAGVSATIWFVGFAAAHTAWQVAILVAMEGAFGWPLFQTAANAMTADLLPEERRADAYSLLRAAINVGVVGGPPIGGSRSAWEPRFGSCSWPPPSAACRSWRSWPQPSARHDPRAPVSPLATSTPPAVRAGRSCSATASSCCSARSRCCRSSASVCSAPCTRSSSRGSCTCRTPPGPWCSP
jgi:hypothetical protein